jgi:hypothetical protein
MRQAERPALKVPAILLVSLLTLGLAAVSQASDNAWIGLDLANWNTDSNWANGVAPDVSFNEAAAINNNTTAVLSAPAMSQGSPVSVGGLKLGQAAANIGGLRITNGGSLTNVAGASETGAIAVGVSGQGNLTILGGGSLSGTSLSLAGVTASSITLGDNSGLTAALTTTGAATLGRTTTVHGKFVNFSAGGNLTLSSASTLIGEINDAAAHSPLKSAGTASIAGTFRPTFTGVTPTAGNSWNIIDAAAISGGFTTFDVSSAPSLPAGQSYQLIQANGGTNGKLLKLSIEEILVLLVNRTSGTISIANIGTTSKSLEGYSVLSSRGTLNLTNWNSLQDQSVSGWVEAGGTVNDLSELNPNSSSTITGGNSLPLGSPYAGQPGVQFPAFGINPDDISFEYSTSDHRTIQGSVVYSGTKVNNNLVVNVNPATGQAQLKNDSPHTVTIDGYAIYSQSNSLQPANGKWFSLQDRGVAGWEEANPATNVVSELNENLTLTLSPFSGYDLGELYKTIGGIQDLKLEFFQFGQDVPSNGAVVYGSFGTVNPPGLTGDYNNNGIVDAGDYVVWRKKSGTNATLPNDSIGGTIGPAQYTQWRSNFGKTSAGGQGMSAASVPEPGTASLLLFVVTAVMGVIQPRIRRG